MHLASSGGKARDAADVLPCSGGLPPPKGYPARRPAGLGRHWPQGPLHPSCSCACKGKGDFLPPPRGHQGERREVGWAPAPGAAGLTELDASTHRLVPQ